MLKVSRRDGVRTGARRVNHAGMALLAVVLACGIAEAGELDPAAKVNDHVITRQRLHTSVEASMQAKHLSYGGITQPAQYKEMERQVLDELIAQELLWQEAQRRGFIATAAEVDQVVEQLRKRYPTEQAYLFELQLGGFTPESYAEDVKHHISVRHLIEETLAKQVTVSKEDLHDAYVANLAQLVEPEQVQARHVLIKVAEDADEAAIAAAKTRIEQVLKEARQGADFAELAKQYSQDSTASAGGELGFVARGAFVPAFEAVAFALKPGEISDIVRTRFGFHIIKVEARREAHALSESEAAPTLQQYVASKKLQQAIQEQVQALRAKGDVAVLIAS